MSLKVIDRAPEVRCYECGSTDIRSVCHHCARPMCALHGSLAVRDGLASLADSADAASSARDPGAAGGIALDGVDAKPTSREYAGLKLLPIRAAVHHCADHYHTVRLIDTAGKFFHRQTPDRELPPLPVFPDVNTATVVERLTGEVRLSDAGYASMPQPVEGEIVIGMTHARARWQETMSRYRKRHQLPEDYPVKFAGGFALLRGKAGLTFDAAQDAILPDGLGLTFSGDVGGHDLFDDKRGRPQGEWEFSARYKLQKARAPQDIPLWIVPSLGATSDKRVLMIDLHWNMPEVDGERPELNQFELIEFEVPHQWGNLQDSSPPGAASSAPAPGQPRIVRWRQHRPAGDDRQQGSGSAAAPLSMTLKMEFEKPILDRPRLTGALCATFDASLSGATGIDFYLPGGGPVKYLDVKPRTEISVRFDISLSSLRYQERRAVPDHSKATGEDRSRVDPDNFIGVMPDYRTVIELTNAISTDGYYVKTVVEDFPHRDAREKTFKRGWDITGRWYEGVFPINFMISLRGTEPEDTVAGPTVGRTVAQVTVDGTFPNAEMKKKIEDKWDGLHARVVGLLAARAVSISDASPGVTHGRVTGRPPEIAASRMPGSAIQPRSIHPLTVGEQGEPPLAWPSTPPPARTGAHGPDDSSGSVVPGEVIEPGSAPVFGDTAGLAAELRQQRGELRLLMAESDRICEANCRAAIADIKAELRYIDHPDEFFAGHRDRQTEHRVAALLRQRRGLRGKLIMGQLSEDFYSDEVADIGADLQDLGWSQ